MRRSTPAYLYLLALAGVVALLFAWAGAETPLRTAVTLAFLCAGPGAALVGWLRLGNPAVEATLAVALSLTVDIAVGQTMVWAHAWSPSTGLLVVVLLTILTIAGQAYWWGSKPGPLIGGPSASTPAHRTKEQR
jgi:hypothetical protein